ncbi:putative E3 ubiquitin-protein ligase DTX3 [Mytilus galloprovincialis]
MEEPEAMEVDDNTFNGIQHSQSAPQLQRVLSEEEKRCSICLDDFIDKKILDKCTHPFCKGCIELHFTYKPTCPVCGTVYGKVIGTQPEGTMTISSSKRRSLPGHEAHGYISVSYDFPDGTQTDVHPKPGKPYYGTSRTGYLPDSPKGRIVTRLLKVAYDRRLVFTVGRSRTTGQDDCVTWNDVHHKTTLSGGPQNFGYPDPTYLDRVLEELAAKGVTEADLHEAPESVIK